MASRIFDGPLSIPGSSCSWPWTHSIKTHSPLMLCQWLQILNVLKCILWHTAAANQHHTHILNVDYLLKVNKKGTVMTLNIGVNIILVSNNIDQIGNNNPDYWAVGYNQTVTVNID
jgi:hypothetical protein